VNGARIRHCRPRDKEESMERPTLAGRGTVVAALLLLAVFVSNSTTLGSDDRGLRGETGSPGTPTERLSVTIPTDAYDLVSTERGSDVLVEDFGRLLVPGKPDLPSRVFSIAVPPGAEVLDVVVDPGEGAELPGTYDIAPARLPRVIGRADPRLEAARLKERDENYSRVYGSDDPYPATPGEFLRRAGYRKYELVDVRITPFAYRPVSKRLIHYPEITVEVSYRAGTRGLGAIVDNLPRTEAVAREIVYNYEQAESWYSGAATENRATHDYVIITLDSLTSAVTTLVDWETTKARSVRVVTTSWIDDNYTGYDLAAKMRNFLREKYPSGEWGIEDVLLVGDYDDVPIRRTAQDLGYGQPETDYYYAELSLPDSSSWDADGDHQYGESSDPIDFYAEVNVGRIPYSDTATVQSICAKSAAFEQNDDVLYKERILLAGAFFWDNDPNPTTDNAVLMEAKIDQPWMTSWNKTRLYEEGHSTYPMDYDLTHANFVNAWSTGRYSFVNWAGHGSPTSAHIYHGTGEAFIRSTDTPQLNDAFPSIVFADSCSNHDTDHADNVGRSLIKRGAVGFVGATKVALGRPGWSDPNDGSSQSLDYFFTVDVTSANYTQGAAHQRSLTKMYTLGLWNDLYYETFEWGALLGNPDLSVGAPAALTISFPDGLPETALPGNEVPVTVRIQNGVEQYVPGSGTLFYRYQFGVFQLAALTPLGGDLYEAVIPASDCDDEPEFFVSVEGDGGTVVKSPSGAPFQVYDYRVGEEIVLLADDCEVDLGWTVGGDALDGQWDRGVPVNCNRGDPPSDCDGSGKSWLTDNDAGDNCNSDVDDGTTWLDSPTIDLGDGTADIGFGLWYTNDYGADPDNDYFNIYVSNDDGANWTLVQTLGPDSSAGWNMHTFNVEDHVTPTDQVKVRFEASDLYSGSVVEAGLDQFSVSRFVCELEQPIPGEPTGLRLALTPPSTTAELSWNTAPNADYYHLYRGVQREATDLECLESGIVGTSTSDDGMVPSDGVVLYYVVTAVNSSGESSAGGARVIVSHCP
jgi:hypothetical protein